MKILTPLKDPRAIITSLPDLLRTLGLSAHLDAFGAPHFAIKVPYHYAKKIRGIDDPLLLQVLPAKRTDGVRHDFVSEPLAEKHFNPIKGLLHKYQNRVLLTLTGACMVHCQYCFRQNFSYHDNTPTPNDEILSYLNDPNINEVILSGGDPFALAPKKLAKWLDFLSHAKIDTVRLHTRALAMLPFCDDELLSALSALANIKNVVIVFHINHAREIDQDLKHLCQALKRHGMTLLNQSVLLKGVNDDADALCALSHALFWAGILPYYLHHLDKVSGAERFYVDETTAVGIYHALMAKTSGYLVPRFVKEEPHAAHKTPINLCLNG